MYGIPKTTHRFNIGDTVYLLSNGKSAKIVGYSGPSGAPSYCVQIDGDSGMTADQPYRYRGENELSATPVVVTKQPFSTRFGNSESEFHDQ